MYITYVLSNVFTHKSHNIIIELGIIIHTSYMRSGHEVWGSHSDRATAGLEMQLLTPNYTVCPFLPRERFWSLRFEVCCGNNSLVVWPGDCVPWERLGSSRPSLELSLCPWSKGDANGSGQVFALAKAQHSAESYSQVRPAWDTTPGQVRLWGGTCLWLARLLRGLPNPK